MKFLLLFVVMLTTITGCKVKNTEYYLTHSDELQKALNLCPQHPPENLSCSQLEDLARSWNSLTRELRIDPQAFGQRILFLQEHISKQKRELLQADNKKSVKNNLQTERQELKMRLILVKIFESPQGS